MSLFHQKRIKIDTTDTKVYLYTPIEYKEQCKKLGAQFDWSCKKWFILQSNENLQKAVDIFHRDNFRTDFDGERMKAKITTETGRLKIAKDKLAILNNKHLKT
jgi:hypothetical protein